MEMLQVINDRHLTGLMNKCNVRYMYMYTVYLIINVYIVHAVHTYMYIHSVYIIYAVHMYAYMYLTLTLTLTLQTQCIHSRTSGRDLIPACVLST